MQLGGEERLRDQFARELLQRHSRMHQSQGWFDDQDDSERGLEMIQSVS